MKSLVQLANEAEDAVKANKNNVVEIAGLDEIAVAYLTDKLGKYNLGRAIVISAENRVPTYVIQVHK